MNSLFAAALTMIPGNAPPMPSEPLAQDVRPQSTIAREELKPPTPTRITRMSNVEAIESAWQDLATLPEADWPFQRYLWIPSGQVEDLKAISFTLNVVSRSAVVKRPFALSPSLVRVDLRLFAPTVVDLGDWLFQWEQLRFDPAFALLLTSDTVKLLGLKAFTIERFQTQQTKAGNWANVVAAVQVKEVKAGDVVSVSAISTPSYRKLQTACLSEAAIVDARYFVLRALSSIKDQGGSAKVFGGLYYEFVGIERKPKQGTAQDAFLKKLGRTEADLERLRSDQRVAMFRSGVTGKPRRVDIFSSGAERGGQSIVTITHDVKDGDVDNTKHPMLALLNVKDAAREVIAAKANGFHYFALFAGNGDLQDEAPPDVVVDRTVPPPHTPRLQTISCIRCHGPDDGLKPLRNDVLDMTRRKAGTILFDNLGGGKAFELGDQLERLAGLYSGSPDKVMMRARDDYAEAVLRATGPWKDEGTQANVVRATAKRVGDIWNGYFYD